MAVMLLAIGLVVWQRSGERPSRAPLQGVTVVQSFPHDPRAFCQGLVFRDGLLYEGTGNYGESSLRKVELETGRVLQQHNLSADLFGEGITFWENQLIQLTWKNRTAIYYDPATFHELQRRSYQGEGWGLTCDGRQLIMSDGTATLRFLDPATFTVQRQLVVRDGSRRINRLNELEYVEGEIYANVWYEDQIVRISPATGRVLGWIDLTRLWPAGQRPHRDAVLNGIAYDAQHQRLFVTGKDWPKLFEIRLGEGQRVPAPLPR
ncbi:MAG: glutaminyl-peptide cyclotransferase [Planctomycetaceae bacterium]|nr:glutaminyl-peptide cyclotransferase [Planctomycetaceae bacterium]